MRIEGFFNALRVRMPLQDKIQGCVGFAGLLRDSERGHHLSLRTGEDLGQPECRKGRRVCSLRVGPQLLVAILKLCPDCLPSDQSRDKRRIDTAADSCELWAVVLAATP